MVSQTHNDVNERSDRFQARYALIFIGNVFLAEIYYRVAEFSMMGGWGLALVVAHIVALGLYFLYTVLEKLMLGYWRQLISVICAPFLAAGIFAFQAVNDLTPDYLQFFVTQPWYLATIKKLEPSENTFNAWFWEETGGGIITPTYTLLIYDKTDQITKPPESRTAEWINRVKLFASRNDLALSAISDNRPYSVRLPRVIIKEIAKHFYFVIQTS